MAAKFFLWAMIVFVFLPIVTFVGLVKEWHILWIICLLFTIILWKLIKRLWQNQQLLRDENENRLIEMAQILKATILKRWVILWFGLWFIVVFLRA